MHMRKMSRGQGKARFCPGRTRQEHAPSVKTGFNGATGRGTLMHMDKLQAQKDLPCD